MELRTILTPAEITGLHSRDLRETWCVVFDVLRATSTIVAALANGAQSVVPVLTPEEAVQWRQERSPKALLGGERGGVRLPGFDLGNSPREYTAEIVRKRDIITTTTNGTVALRAAVGAQGVLAAGLINLAATANFLRTVTPTPTKILLVCAGTGDEFALEDGIAAGTLANKLVSAGAHVADDATAAMMELYKRSHGDLPDALENSVNGRRLYEIGLGEDVAWCARESLINLVAIMHAGALVAYGAG